MMTKGDTENIVHAEPASIIGRTIHGARAGHRRTVVAFKICSMCVSVVLACEACFSLPVLGRWSLPSSGPRRRFAGCAIGCENMAWGETLRQCRNSDATPCFAFRVREAEELRFLQPLETMKPAASSAQKELVMPCFPLPLARAALPGTRRTLNICEKRYVDMINDMLLVGQRQFVVPRLRNAWGKPPTRGVELAETAVVFELLDVRDPPAASKFSFVCVHEVRRPVRITKVLNPEVYAEKDTYLRVECEELSDKDLEISFKMEERALLDALYEIVRLRASTGDPLRRLEYTLGANGQLSLVDNHLLPTISEDSLGLTSASRDTFWELAALWQGYCDRRGVSLRQQFQRDTHNRRASEVADLRENYEAEATELASTTSDLMQSLLQAETHGARLAAFQMAADQEMHRLGAIAAIHMVSGGEANA